MPHQKHSILNLSRKPTELWILVKLQQYWNENSSKFDKADTSGISVTTNTRQDSNFLNSETSTKKHRNNELKQTNHMNHLEENLSIYKIGENGNGNITLAFFNKPATWNDSAIIR